MNEKTKAIEEHIIMPNNWKPRIVDSDKSLEQLFEDSGTTLNRSHDFNAVVDVAVGQVAIDKLTEQLQNADDKIREIANTYNTVTKLTKTKQKSTIKVSDNF